MTAITFVDLLDWLSYADDEFVSICNDMVDPATGEAKFQSAVHPLATVKAMFEGPIPTDVNIWFGVNPIRGTLPKGRRGGAEHVTRLAAGWADLDIKAGGCPDLATAHMIIDDLTMLLGTPPTVIVASGHGLQPYWPIEPYETTTVDVGVLLRRWGRLVARVAGDRGVKVDSVFDLPRVLRVPGSVNNKGVPVLVTASEIGGAPLGLDELDERLYEAGIYADDLEASGTEVLSAAAEWTWAPHTCDYVTAMVKGWATDTPTARHPWLYSQAIRLTCAHRNGCLTEQGYRDARNILTARFERITTDRAITRSERGIGAGSIWNDAIGEVVTKTDDQVRKELGRHGHIGDLNITAATTATAAAGSPGTASSNIPNGDTPVVSTTDLWPSPSRPLEVARELRKRHYLLDGDDKLPTLLRWRGDWMTWQKTHWTTIDAEDMQAIVYQALGDAAYLHPNRGGAMEPVHWNPNKNKVVNVLDALKAETLQPSTLAPPCWIGIPRVDGPATDMISFANTLLHLPTRDQHDHTPALFNTLGVPFDYQPDAPKAKQWLTFLDTLWHDDPDSILLLQEYFGYLLSGRTNLQKMLVMVGPSRSGKGTIARIMEAILGAGSHTAINLTALTQQFGVADLIGKSLAVISDSRFDASRGGGIAVAVERILNITGEDPVSIDRKNRESWVGQLPTRFVLLSNEIPRLADNSGAVVHRMLLLAFTESFIGREDITLAGKLRTELPGIVNWALAGLDRLNEQGHFTETESGRDAFDDMMDAASPVTMFVAERCRLDLNEQAYSDDLYAAWKVWAALSGHHWGSKGRFFVALNAAFPKQVRRIKPRDGKLGDDGLRKPVAAYSGIGISLLPVDAGEFSAAALTQERITRNGFQQPSGPDRCTECGFHAATQGHRPDCRVIR